VNDILIKKISEPHQTIVVLAGEGYVALELFFDDDARVADEAVLLGLSGAEALAYSLSGAVIKAREAASQRN
jgi:hypothetical protein